MAIERTFLAVEVNPNPNWEETQLITRDEAAVVFVDLKQLEVEELIEKLAESIGQIADLRPRKSGVAEHGREEPLTYEEIAATPYADILDAAYRNTSGAFA